MDSIPIDVCSYFAKRMYAEMEKQGITIDELSERSGVSDKLIYNYKTQYRKPRIDTFLLICIGLNVSPNELLNWKEIEKNVRTEQNSLEKSGK